MAASRLPLTHTQQVTRLYRKSLKHLLSRIIDREIWRQTAVDLRDVFDSNKNLDHTTAARCLREGEELFEHYKHPFPYIPPTAPDGSKWERNIPPPPHVLEMTPEEKEWYKQWCKHGPK